MEVGGGAGDFSAGGAARVGLSTAPGGGAVGTAMSGLWRGVNFIVDGKASAPGAGGGFELDIETAEDLYREALSLATELERQVRDARMLRLTRPPAEDPASVGFNNVGAQAFEAGAQHVEVEANFYQGLAEALEKALGIYQESDEKSGEDVTISGGEAGSGGGLI